MDEKRLRPLLSPVLEAQGLELDAVEVQPAGRRTVLRVVVDGDGRSGRGPDLDEIAEATGAVSAVLDESEVVGKGAYTLEVTSRGVSRPLTRPAHWRRNRGRLVEVKRSGAEPLTGRIGASDDEGAVLEVDGRSERVVFASMGAALVQIEFNRRAEPEDPGAGADDENDENDENDEDEED